MPRSILKAVLLPLALVLGGCAERAQASAEASRESPARSAPRLLEYGWDMPTPPQLAQAEALLDASPFDGLTLRLSAGQQIFWQGGLDEASVLADVKILQGVRSPKLRNSYLSMYAGSGDGWDWFDDAQWATAERSARLMARAAKAAGLRGINFDMEPYQNNPWQYEAQAAAGQHDFAAYQTKIRARGRALIRAVQSEYPGIQIYTLFLMSAESGDLEGGPPPAELQRRLQDSGYGLWPAFVNGMLEGANPSTSFVEGNEPAYYYLHAGQFQGAERDIKTGLLPLVDPQNHARYARQVQVGSAVFADGLMNLWKSPRFCGYYLNGEAEQAALLQHNVYFALRHSRGPVWFYNENMNWWDTGQEGGRVPASVVRALSEAKRKLAAGSPLDLDLGFLPAAETACNAKVSVGGDLTEGDAGVQGVKFRVNGVVSGEAIDPFCTTWNAGRRYSCTFPGGWSGTVAPVAAGRTFDPPERRYEQIVKNDWQAHFTVKP